MGVEFTEEHLQAIIETNTIVKEMKEQTAARRQDCSQWFIDHEKRMRSVERWRYYMLGLYGGITGVLYLIWQYIPWGKT